MNRFAGVCDRCAALYTSRTFPHIGICPSCFLGSLPGDQRGKLFGHLSKTGERM